MGRPYQSGFCLALFIALSASCQEESEQLLEDDAVDCVSITALLPDSDTRATYSSVGMAEGINLEWNAADRLAVYGKKSLRAYSFAMTGSDGTVSQWHPADDGFKDYITAEPLVGICPASMYDDGKAICDFSLQDGSLQGLQGCDLMVSTPTEYHSRRATLAFLHLNAFVRLAVDKTLLSGPSDITMLLNGPEGSKVSTLAYDINQDSYELMGSSDFVTVECAEAPESNDTHYLYYIAWPVSADKLPLSNIVLRQSGADIATYSLPTNIPAEAGKVYDIVLGN